jgi:endonuclease/exonuclease/phosphatase family metal-dependent hydrolase
MLQIVTFNIGGARKLRKPPHNPVKLGQDAAQTVKQVIDPAQPAFIALQETGTITWKGGHAESAHVALKNALGEGYSARFAPELTTTLHPHAHLWNREPYAGMESAQEGNGFVTNMPFAKWDWQVYEGIGDYWTHTQISHAVLYSSGNRNTQPRNVIVASLAHPEYGDLYLLNTHFGTLTGEKRHDAINPRTQEGENLRRFQAAQVKRVVRELRQAEEDNDKPARPIILAGDFNATPDAPSMRDFLPDFALLPIEDEPPNNWTHAGHKILIDHVFVNDPRGVLPSGKCFIQTNLPFDDLTDHRPVIAVFG